MEDHLMSAYSTWLLEESELLHSLAWMQEYFNKNHTKMLYEQQQQEYTQLELKILFCEWLSQKYTEIVSGYYTNNLFIEILEVEFYDNMCGTCDNCWEKELSEELYDVDGTYYCRHCYVDEGFAMIQAEEDYRNWVPTMGAKVSFL